MALHIEWGRPVVLRNPGNKDIGYVLDLDKVTSEPGVYIFGRSWSRQFQALYVGQATNLRTRIKGHLNNLRLMQHLRKAKTGKRVLLVGRLVTRPGQKLGKCLKLAERAFIRHFLSQGHDLVNKQGARLRWHEILSSGQHPKRFFPKEIHLEKAKGE